MPLRLSNFLPLRTPSKSHISTSICSWNSISFVRITGGYPWRPDQWWFSMAHGVTTLLVYYHLWHLEQKKHPPHSLASSLLKPKMGYEVNQKGTLWLSYYFIAELWRAKRACRAPWVSKSTHPRKLGNHVTIHRPSVHTTGQPMFNLLLSS